jgi:TPR repeat protein
MPCSSMDQNYQQAVSWNRKAADGGDPTEMAYLGDMYENGKGVSKDQLIWYRNAAQLGSQYAKDALKRLGENP